MGLSRCQDWQAGMDECVSAGRAAKEAVAVKVAITARELMDRYLWDRACDLLGISPWAVSEGQMDSSDTVELTQEQARELGILASDV